KTLCIVLVAAVVLYGAAKILTGVFYLPQKTLAVAKYDGEKITMAEYNYYYISLYNQMYSLSSQYDQYYGSGSGASYTGFDYSANPADQEYTLEEIEGVKTWADYFKVTATEKAFLQKELYDAAMNEKGFKLTEDEKAEIKKEIEDQMTQIEEAAAKNEYSVNNYIPLIYGEGLTEKSYTELLNRDYVVEKYLEWYQDNMIKTLSDEEVNSYFKENSGDFLSASARVFAISYSDENVEDGDPVYTKEQAKKLANEFAGKVTDEASFIKVAKEYALPSVKDSYADDSATLASGLKKSNLEETSKEMADWLFNSKTAVGDIKVFDIEDSKLYYIIYVTETASLDEQTAGADVRHILVQVETTKENDKGEEVALSEKEIATNWAKAKTEAEAILKEWKSGDATEESFAALATEKTDDTGSAETGGLYEDINSESSYVPEFLDWALAPHKAGDTEIIKTSYGYHIMYFVGADEMPKWESDVRKAITSEKYTEYTEKLYNDIKDNVEVTDWIVDYFIKNTEKLVKRYVDNANSYS
ncbi:MAG: peptidylprolyl isomerase, partial [Oscillospiraceae bacterium]|nr:peptidylprolyl isomerase [Oscillospiraceae bacterium]